MGSIPVKVGNDFFVLSNTNDFRAYQYHINTNIWEPYGTLSENLDDSMYGVSFGYGNKIYNFEGRAFPRRTIEYDILTDQWHSLSITPPDSLPNSNLIEKYCLPVYHNGLIYIFGGKGNYINEYKTEIWKYNISSDTWNVIDDSINHPNRLTNCEVSFIGNIAYLVDSFSGNYSYNIDSKVWTHLAEPLVTNGHMSSVTYDGKIYSVAGNNLSMYWPE